MDEREEQATSNFQPDMDLRNGNGKCQSAQDPCNREETHGRVVDSWDDLGYLTDEIPQISALRWPNSKLNRNSVALATHSD